MIVSKSAIAASKISRYRSDRVEHIYPLSIVRFETVSVPFSYDAAPVRIEIEQSSSSRATRWHMLPVTFCTKPFGGRTAHQGHG